VKDGGEELKAVVIYAEALSASKQNKGSELDKEGG